MNGLLSTYRGVKVGLSVLFGIGVWLYGVASGDLYFAALGGAVLFCFAVLGMALIRLRKSVLAGAAATALLGVAASGGMNLFWASKRAAATAVPRDHRAELLAGLHDPEASVRRDSARALGTHRPFRRECVPELANLMADPAPEVRSSAGLALADLAPLAGPDPT